MALYADPVFLEPGLYNSSALWVAVIAYALQVYGDFSGYSDMAVGLAHLLGYKLARNFSLPYLASSIAEFWHRWHISLSTWLRDYLFIPLGGSRGGRWRTCLNLMITMTLGGLWHGARWTFVAWGVLHGLLLVGHRLFRECSKVWIGLGRLHKPGAQATGPNAPVACAPGLCRSLGTVASVAGTFLCVTLLWVFFRAPTFAGALQVLSGLFVHRAGLGSPLNSTGMWVTAVLVLLCHLFARNGGWKWLLQRLPEPARGLGYAMVLLLALLLTPELGNTFIYFQF